jgi:hypothetical protein
MPLSALCYARPGQLSAARVVPRQIFIKWSKSTPIQLFLGLFSLFQVSFLLFSLGICYFLLENQPFGQKNTCFDRKYILKILSGMSVTGINLCVCVCPCVCECVQWQMAR